MRNKSIILLGMVVLLLSFFVFDSGNNITGLVFSGGVVIPSFFEDKAEINYNPEFTELYSDRVQVRRGDKTYVLVVPGEWGVLSEVGFYNDEGEFKKYFYVCGIGKACYSAKKMPVEISRSAFKPGDYELRFFDLKKNDYIKFAIKVV